MLIVNNIANIYEKMGDKQNALKYYRIVANSNDAKYVENAKFAIKELNISNAKPTCGDKMWLRKSRMGI